MNPVLDLEFSKELAPSRATELSYFLYLYKAAYAILVDKFGGLEIEKLIDSYEGIAKDAVFLLGGAQEHISSSFFSDLSERELLITRIQKDSPLLIALAGVGGVALLAAIIAGGEIEFEGLGVKVRARFNRLGDGIAALRDAFHGKPRVPSKPKKRQ